MKPYWIFLFAAIFCALSADRIDKAARANEKVKKIFYAVSIGLFVLTILWMAVLYAKTYHL